MPTTTAHRSRTVRSAARRPSPSKNADCLNLGCGSRHTQGWTNVDIRSRGSEVIGHDLRRPLPFDDQSFDFVYSSHVLEHFDRDQGEAFVRESVRVLRPSGILRVVVPDMEHLARLYLQSLERAEAGEPKSDADYDWSYLLLYDQTSRSQAGGKMLEYLRQDSVPNRDFVIACCGSEVAAHLDAPVKERTGLKKLFSRENRQKFWRTLFGSRYDAMRLGKFRQSGEVHQWMYDRYSLARLFRHCGLTDIQRKTAAESGLASWSQWHLDVDPNGQVYKPESIFMEGVKQ